MQEMLLRAIRTKDVRSVARLINSETDLSFRDEFNQDALFYSVVYYEPKILEFILSRGIDIRVTYKDKKSILHIAVESNLEEKGQFRAIQSLVDAGAEVNARDRFGNTPLWYACTYYVVNNQTINYLLTHGADMYIDNKYGLNVYSSAKQNERVELLHILDKYAKQY